MKTFERFTEKKRNAMLRKQIHRIATLLGIRRPKPALLHPAWVAYVQDAAASCRTLSEVSLLLMHVDSRRVRKEEQHIIDALRARLVCRHKSLSTQQQVPKRKVRACKSQALNEGDALFLWN